MNESKKTDALGLSFREETDSLGSEQIDAHALYGIQTVRAYHNFNISQTKVNQELLYSIITIKKAAAMAHQSLHLMNEEKATAIIHACDEAYKGTYNEFFLTNAYQGGAGTSTNMNVNEVICNAALQLLSHTPGEYQHLHPLDDVNKGQSTNDVYPTALRITAIKYIRLLSEECSKLQESLQHKEQEFSHVIKLGRTELMDALPITLGQEFGCFAQAIQRDRWRIYKAEERLRTITLGGTAVGTGSNTNLKYTFLVIEYLRDLTNIGLARSEYPMDLTQNNDVFVEVSGLLKALAVNLMKIASDLRLMNSGPNGGLGEIELEKLQSGSTLMPGKVNPVLPEMITQVALKVIANDSSITSAASLGNFELNAFLPFIAYNLLESLELLIESLKLFRTKCIDTIKAREDNCKKHLTSSIVIVSALTPYLGYDTATNIVTKCNNDPSSIRELVVKEFGLDEKTLNKIFDFQNEMTYFD